MELHIENADIFKLYAPADALEDTIAPVGRLPEVALAQDLRLEGQLEAADVRDRVLGRAVDDQHHLDLLAFDPLRHLDFLRKSERPAGDVRLRALSPVAGVRPWPPGRPGDQLGGGYRFLRASASRARRARRLSGGGSASGCVPAAGARLRTMVFGALGLRRPGKTKSWTGCISSP
jgi:hypothetical protein